MAPTPPAGGRALEYGDSTWHLMRNTTLAIDRNPHAAVSQWLLRKPADITPPAPGGQLPAASSHKGIVTGVAHLLRDLLLVFFPGRTWEFPDAWSDVVAEYRPPDRRAADVVGLVLNSTELDAEPEARTLPPRMGEATRVLRPAPERLVLHDLHRRGPTAGIPEGWHAHHDRRTGRYLYVGPAGAYSWEKPFVPPPVAPPQASTATSTKRQGSRGRTPTRTTGGGRSQSCSSAQARKADAARRASALLACWAIAASARGRLGALWQGARAISGSAGFALGWKVHTWWIESRVAPRRPPA